MTRIPEQAHSVNALSIEGLISWLETCPAEKRYDYIDFKNCLAAQYLKTQGLVYEISRISGRKGEFLHVLEYISAGTTPKTFGNALTLAKIIQEEQAAQVVPGNF